MKKIILTTAALSLGIMFAAAGAASAEGRSATFKRAQATSTQMKIAAKPGATAGPRDNTAPAWTAGCYAEFGPNAKYPDAAMLEKCLSY
ncbi:hypothetical protein PZ897_09650 [Hoeflea sp. YIM 152468]|uniref:hypothetical protein n=1 Tax=Hoeflea sp. YIM 152468 TaxID=3031759 RepID=UPI0023D9FAF8|nr:hypothetical protein [Hoeflea sp. YIM 152468]MDF1608440.1 hypothetical protein [Hoeflea sp. YIM 152468]